MKHSLTLSAVSACTLVLTACASQPTATPKISQTKTTLTQKSNNTHNTTKRPTIALVLGGGGARGFAHIGVIDVLEKNGIRPDLVVGTSSGAVVGSVYASGKTPQQLLTLAQTLQVDDLVDFTPSNQGFIEGKKLRQFINTQVNQQPIEKFPMRFAAVATKLKDKQTVSFSQGEAGLAVQASSSVANVFIPPRIPENHGDKYIDGSVNALVPARIARSLGADVVISVDVMAKQNSSGEKDAPAKASISRTETGISAKWGSQTVDIPIRLPKADTKPDDLPFDLPIGAIFEGILKALPENVEMEIPEHLPKELPTNPKDAWKLFGQIGAGQKAHPDDLAASDVIISPNVANYAVFNTKERQALIDEGRNATQAQLDAIKKSITNAQYRYVGAAQTVQ